MARARRAQNKRARTPKTAIAPLASVPKLIVKGPSQSTSRVQLKGEPPVPPARSTRRAKPKANPKANPKKETKAPSILRPVEPSGAGTDTGAGAGVGVTLVAADPDRSQLPARAAFAPILRRSARHLMPPSPGRVCEPNHRASKPGPSVLKSSSRNEIGETGTVSGFYSPADLARYLGKHAREPREKEITGSSTRHVNWSDMLEW